MFSQVCGLFLLFFAPSEADPSSDCVKVASSQELNRCQAFFDCCRSCAGNWNANCGTRGFGVKAVILPEQTTCNCDNWKGVRPPEKQRPVDKFQKQQQNLATFREDALKTHNKLRKRHGVKPLKANKDLKKMAQQYAEVLAKENRFDHNPVAFRQRIGENLYWSSGEPTEGTDAVNSWYDEIDDPGYDFDRQGFTKGTGHLTQVLWKGTERVGCGRAKSATGIYVVCNYHPAGNIIGLFEQNVFPAKNESMN